MARHAPTTSALAGVALLTVVAGCGGGAKATPQEQVRQTLATYQRATANHDYRTLCDRVFAPQLIGHIERTSFTCQSVLEHSTAATVMAPKLTVDRVTVHGDQATAVVHSGAPGEPSSTDVIILVPDHGVWKIAAQGPAPGSPSQPPPAASTRRSTPPPSTGPRSGPGAAHKPTTSAPAPDTGSTASPPAPKTGSTASTPSTSTAKGPGR